MKKILLSLVGVLLFLASGCETMEHWLFNASDYHLIETKSEEDDNTIYWDDFDYDFWEEDLEYD
jgi:hypothetical protein